MKYYHLCPAEYVIHIFGGVTATAEALGRSPSTISEWREGAMRGTKGLIPTAAQNEILQIAKKKNLPITEKNLISGGLVKAD